MRLFYLIIKFLIMQKLFGIMKWLIVLLSIVLIAGCTVQDNTQLANPSAVYCEEQGYTYEIRNTPDGQTGFCVFDDGSECDGWDYHDGECSEETASICKDLCGDGTCDEMVCQGTGCPCAETIESCAWDCS